MTCEELRDDYELYAMGLAEDPARGELRNHLGDRCTACTAGVKGAYELMSYLAGTAPSTAPPGRLRKRILASVGVRGRHWGWTAALAAVAAGLLIGTFYFSAESQRRMNELAETRQALQSRGVELASLNEALDLLNEPEARQVVFGQGTRQPPRGRVFVHPSRGVLLIASNLPPAPAGKTYEMWVIPKGGQPVPAGLFQSQQDGSALHLRAGPVDIAATAVVAVTLEPAGGVPAPTSQPIIVAAL